MARPRRSLLDHRGGPPAALAARPPARHPVVEPDERSEEASRPGEATYGGGVVGRSLLDRRHAVPVVEPDERSEEASRPGEATDGLGDTGRVQVRDVGPRAVLVEVADAGQARSVAAHVRASGLEVVEVVPGARTVLLDGLADPEQARRALAGWTPAREAPAGRLVEVPVTYDGADLEDVARRWRTDVEGVVARHTSVELVSAFCGFAPGFAYLAGLPEGLAVPRLDSPRPRVPAGSVALAGTWCGVYPSASPGGWLLLGRTDAVLWDVDRDEPALLAPGTRVRFVSAGRA